MVFIQPIYSTATHFPIRKNTEVSMEQIIALKAVHMRCLSASICVSGAYMDLSESPAWTRLFCGCSKTVRLQLWIEDWVSGLSHSLGLIASVWWFAGTCAVKCLATTGCLAKPCTGNTLPCVIPLLEFSLELLHPHMQIVSQILCVWLLLWQFGL